MRQFQLNLEKAYYQDYNSFIVLMPSNSLRKEDIEQKSDESLLESIQAGSSEAFSELVNRHNLKFYQLAFKVLNNQSDAEDVVQDCFLKLWKNPFLWSKEKKTKFTTWFYRVISNKALDQKKKFLPNQINDDFEVASQTNLEKDLDQKQKNIIVTKLLEELPERQRVAVCLCYEEDLSVKEAADVLEVSYKALESLLSRAKTFLRKRIKELEEKGVIL